MAEAWQLANTTGLTESRAMEAAMTPEAAHGDWDRAHGAAQAGEDAASAWVHAYLHRVEGDLANADYWYRRAGRQRPVTELQAEWVAIAAALLPEGVARRTPP
jgi:hypothetical protein